MHTSFLAPYLAAGLALGFGAVAGAAQGDVKFVSGQFRLDVPMPAGRAVLELVAEHPHVDQVHVRLDAQSSANFRDDGRDFDSRAGDGVFTAVVPADLDRERQTFERLVEGLRRDLQRPVFEGREHVDTIRTSELIPRPTKKPTLPILTASASTTVVAANSVAIRDLSVVEEFDQFTFNPCANVGNPNGVWTFGHLMTELAGATNPSDFTKNWLEHWLVDQPINGFSAPQRPQVHDDVINSWPVDGNGDLDMTRAPFRLLAIMNRVDLRSSTGYGSGNAGEARFVFCFMENLCTPRPFLVIFEYAIDKTGCDVRDWGQQWADLSDLPLGSPAYNAALAAITQQFTDLTSNPQGHALGQLRTNEFIDFPWELREFVLPGTGFLVQDTVKLTPDTGLDGSTTVGDIMNGATGLLPAIEGASSINPFMFWNAPNWLDNDDRHAFSLNTCNACHSQETNTIFTHIDEGPFGAPVIFSGFLTGITVSDPVSGVPRVFDDIARREQDLQDLIDSSCFGVLVHHVLLAVH